MSPITTHILDTSLGKPAEGVAVTLEQLRDGGATKLGDSVTNADGRATDLLEPGRLEAGAYRLTFEVSGYFASSGRESFYPQVQIDFQVTAPAEHHHVPLLLSPHGYTTYRGS
ncbi:MAG: hydroxyisourate hydrolase [Planctomycetota bacterium]